MGTKMNKLCLIVIISVFVGGVFSSTVFATRDPGTYDPSTNWLKLYTAYLNGDKLASDIISSINISALINSLPEVDTGVTSLALSTLYTYTSEANFSDNNPQHSQSRNYTFEWRSNTPDIPEDINFNNPNNRSSNQKFSSQSIPEFNPQFGSGFPQGPGRTPKGGDGLGSQSDLSSGGNRTALGEINIGVVDNFERDGEGPAHGEFVVKSMLDVFENMAKSGSLNATVHINGSGWRGSSTYKFGDGSQTININLYGVRSTENGGLSTSDILTQLDKAASENDIVNGSFGADLPDGFSNWDQVKNADPAFAQFGAAMEDIFASHPDTTFVFSAGNTGGPTGFPAALSGEFPNVLSVAAENMSPDDIVADISRETGIPERQIREQLGNISGFTSSPGDIVADGTTILNGWWSIGTSFASPHAAAGLAAAGLAGGVNPQDLIAAVIQTSNGGHVNISTFNAAVRFNSERTGRVASAPSAPSQPVLPPNFGNPFGGGNSGFGGNPFGGQPNFGGSPSFGGSPFGGFGDLW